MARIKGGSLFLRRAFGQERYWSFPLSLSAYRRLLPFQSSCSPTLLLPQTLCCSAVNLNTADPARVRNLGTSRGRQRPSSLPPLAELTALGRHLSRALSGSNWSCGAPALAPRHPQRQWSSGEVRLLAAFRNEALRHSPPSSSASVRRA